jgi:prepilin-type N-terminal cleavage/methylation domain-containing protein
MRTQTKVSSSRFKSQSSPTRNLEPGTWNSRVRRGFTLTELLIVMLVIGIMAGLALSALSGATELAREQRTRAIISKLDQLIMERYEGYRTRAVPLRVPPNAGPRGAAFVRLTALRDLMRMELPDRRSDILNFLSNPPTLQITASGISQSSLQKSYFRKAVRTLGGANNLANWTSTHEGAECLYLIVSTMHDGDKNALDFFSPNEVGDVDEDGMKEILDGWGNPIEFIRWPAGYTAQPGPDGEWGIAGADDDGNGTVDDLFEAGWPGSDDVVPQTMQTLNYLTSPDPFDPAKADPRWGAGTGISYVGVAPQPFALHPLIVSAGRDRLYDIDVGGGLVYVQTARAAATPQPAVPPNDPYYAGSPPGELSIVGRVFDANLDGYLNFMDNITNHFQETP